MATRLSGAPLRSPLDLAATSSSLAYPVHALGLGSRGFTPPERLRPLLRMPAGAGDKEAEAKAEAKAEAEAAEDEAVGAHDIFSLGVLSHLVLCASRPRNGVGPALGRGSAPSARPVSVRAQGAPARPECGPGRSEA